VIERRAFVGSLVLGVLTEALAGQAQPAGKVPRIDVLLTVPPELPLSRALLDAFRQGLREHGYVEGQNIAIEYVSARGRVERFPELAVELVRLKVDVIVTGATPAALAAKHTTTTIPIVAGVMADPVKDGLVASLARPGGNVTGLTFLAPGLVAICLSG
jgi:putative ABC transport system substrate-binding protein